MIEEFAKLIPAKFLSASGSVFYSGRQAFASKYGLYIVGLNPGGAPNEKQGDTVEGHTRNILESAPDNWSAYRDESWQGAAPGLWGMQPRVLHLIRSLGYSPETTPASNIIFVRSRRESDISKVAQGLADKCWPFHQAVIEELQPKVIVCFGKRAGLYVQKRIGANEKVDEFIENNKRKWRSLAFKAIDGTYVIIATHPSIADWTTKETDPTPMINRLITNTY